MNAYICREKGDESAMLVFAPTAKRARKISFGNGWHDAHQSSWLDWTARRMYDLPPHLASLDNGAEQVIDSPPTCPNCDLWGGVDLGDRCSLCQEEAH